jgi:hypothetical protein
VNGQMPPGYFAQIAAVWLRLVAVLFLFYSAVSIIYMVIWRPERDGHAAVLLYTAGAVLLWVASRPLGRLVGRGLDDSSSGPPAV